MESKDLKLIDKKEMLDCISNIETELKHNNIDNSFITVELNIMKELLDKDINEIIPNPYKLPIEFSILYGKHLIQVYFDVLSKIYGYDLQFLTTKNRKQKHVVARSVFCYLVYKSVGGVNNCLISLEDLGEFLNHKDHTSVMHCIKLVVNGLEMGNQTYINYIMKGIKALRLNKLKLSDIELETLKYIENKKVVKKINLEDPS